MQQQADVAVIGAGIVGLATAYHLALKGKKVVVFERTPRATGASFRNFGLVWTIGQQAGAIYDRALYGRGIWKEIAAKTGLSCEETGSLHLGYHNDEVAVMEEFARTGSAHCEVLTAKEAAQKSNAFQSNGLKAALWSPMEMMLDPRVASATLAAFLQSEYKVDIHFNTAVNGISMPFVETKNGQWKVEQVYVCSGQDFETLYPSVFEAAPITRCKLQMMRTVSQPGNWKLGPALSTGLSMLHYASFAQCPSLPALRKRIEASLPEYLQYGIHLLVSQNGAGELSLGDSHEYGKEVDPFDKELINQLILQYIKTFLLAPSFEIKERWHGVYPKLTNGETDLVLQPEPGVTILNGLGGAGMTLSFGLARDVTAKF
ncbi:TIGR03364 family FAD-dependent oxidoreductase [Chitinophaga barathri]|uniref:TIGR03364 family FAD-dependent oxidoreductase n=1 Tax=Chitinophaga barathri TaxID=1647451 RepID=A0A3N4M6V6_9BACT|nr:TIGR03364 family FAD-dependent oxidoreductase [Chitinophaga barathri]RPD38938.1 TIGR03364 family FAD-dependent oxidoreductase [Chitinophaga barathri]